MMMLYSTYSKYYNYCLCLLIYILQHYYPKENRKGFDCVQGGGRAVGGCENPGVPVVVRWA